MFKRICVLCINTHDLCYESSWTREFVVVCSLVCAEGEEWSKVSEQKQSSEWLCSADGSMNLQCTNIFFIFFFFCLQPIWFILKNFRISSSREIIIKKKKNLHHTNLLSRCLNFDYFLLQLRQWTPHRRHLHVHDGRHCRSKNDAGDIRCPRQRWGLNRIHDHNLHGTCNHRSPNRFDQRDSRNFQRVSHWSKNPTKVLCQNRHLHHSYSIPNCLYDILSLSSSSSSFSLSTMSSDSNFQFSQFCQYYHRHSRGNCHDFSAFSGRNSPLWWGWLALNLISSLISNLTFFYCLLMLRITHRI